MAIENFLRVTVCLLASCLIGCTPVDGLGQMPDDVQDKFSKIELSDNDLDAWRSHIMPDKAELAWMKIPWLPTFQEGIVKGAKEARPVLLWTMNGHPLGCT